MSRVFKAIVTEEASIYYTPVSFTGDYSAKLKTGENVEYNVDSNEFTVKSRNGTTTKSSSFREALTESDYINTRN